MKNLDNKKNGTLSNIPSNCLKEVSEVTAPCLRNIWNSQIISGQTFPDNLKLADITPVFKKDTTPYACDESTEKILRLLEENTDLALCWFENNYMKLNIDKCCLIVLGYKHENEQVWAQIGEDKMFQSIDVKLLGVTIDKEFKFDKHVSKICSKASRKLTVLARMSKFLTFEKRKTFQNFY